MESSHPDVLRCMRLKSRRLDAVWRRSTKAEIRKLPINAQSFAAYNARHRNNNKPGAHTQGRRGGWTGRDPSAVERHITLLLVEVIRADVGKVDDANRVHSIFINCCRRRLRQQWRCGYTANQFRLVRPSITNATRIETATKWCLASPRLKRIVSKEIGRETPCGTIARAQWRPFSPRKHGGHSPKICPS